MSETDAVFRHALDLELALALAVGALAEIEAELRADVIRCCDDRNEFCESYGCSTISALANRLQKIRRDAVQAKNARYEVAE